MADGVSINWGALQPVDVGGAFQHGVLAGRQQRAERETRNALKAYAANPEDTQAVNALLPYNPQLAMKLRQDQTQRQAQTIQQRAAAGDPAALARLAGIDHQAFTALDNANKENLKRSVDYVGQSARYIASLPEQQRGAAWDNAIRLAPQYGVTGLEGQAGKYSLENLQAALASAGQVGAYLDSQKVEYKVIPDGGTVAPFSAATGQYVGPAGGVAGAGSQLPTGPSPSAPPAPQLAGSQGAGPAQEFMTPQQATMMRQSLGDAGFAAWQKKHGTPVRLSSGRLARFENGAWHYVEEGR